MMLNVSNSLKVCQVICSDISGCSHYRLRWNSLYLTSFIERTGILPILLDQPILDDSYLRRTESFVFQRPNKNSLSMLSRLKGAQAKFGYKIVFELDDINWDVPDYNISSLTMDQKGIFEAWRDVLPYCDRVITSTEHLKKRIERDFDCHCVTVVPNAVPRFLWNQHRDKLTHNISKPKLIYTGAPQHYRNPEPISRNNLLGVSARKGDWSDEWIEFILMNVIKDKIDLTVFGGFPYFFEGIRDRVKYIPWVDCNSFPNAVMMEHADFSISPLAENEFNRCKSNLKLLEASAMGIPFIGTRFKDGPYEFCKTDLKDFWSYCEPDAYNSIVEWQDRFMEQTGGYIESEKHMNKLLEALS